MIPVLFYMLYHSENINFYLSLFFAPLSIFSQVLVLLMKFSTFLLWYWFPHIFGNSWFGSCICLRLVPKVGEGEQDVLLDEEYWVTPFLKGTALSLQLTCSNSLLQPGANASPVLCLTRSRRGSLGRGKGISSPSIHLFWAFKYHSSSFLCCFCCGFSLSQLYLLSVS